jgi:hypothetical protein
MALFICQGYWKDSEQPILNVTISDGSWDEVEGAEDDRIFFYTDGSPVVADHGEFVIVKAEPTGE